MERPLETLAPWKRASIWKASSCVCKSYTRWWAESRADGTGDGSVGFRPRDVALTIRSASATAELNRGVLFAALQQKTLYKYLLAPINGISAGTILTGFIVWVSV